MGHRLRALLVAILAFAGVAWSVRRLQAVGAPVLPAFLTRAIPADVQAAATRAADGVAFFAVHVGAFVVEIMQIAVAALAVVGVLALLMALRRPRRARSGPVRIVQQSSRPVTSTEPSPLPLRCPTCGKPVQDDWVACPACTNRLPARRAS